MSYSKEDYEADIRDEYRAEEAYEALEEEAYWNCKHEEWSITDAGIIDVEGGHVTGVLAEIRGGEQVKKAKAVIEIKCDSCGRENYGRVEWTKILKLLRDEFEHSDGLEIDEDGWGE